MLSAVLIIHLCSAAVTDACVDKHDEVPAIAVPLNIVSCYADGQIYAADWISEHPSWRLGGWGCQIGGAQRQGGA